MRKTKKRESEVKGKPERYIEQSDLYDTVMQPVDQLEVVQKPAEGEQVGDWNRSGIGILDEIRAFVGHIYQEKENMHKEVMKTLPRGYKKILLAANEIRAKHMSSEEWNKEVKSGNLQEQKYWRKYLTDDECKTFDESKRILRDLVDTHPFSPSCITWCTEETRMAVSEEMIQHTGELRILEPQIRTAVETGKISDSLLMDILNVGMMWERMNIRRKSKPIEALEKHQMGVERGGERVKIANTKDICAFIQKELRNQVRSGDKERISDAIGKAAIHFKINPRTVYRHWAKVKK